VAVGADERFSQIRSRVVEVFGADDGMVERVARVVRLLEIGWHDIYGDPNPPGEVLDDVLACSQEQSKD
jgi:hypothetical protein